MKKYNILTIERQYASGGSQIARELSDRLGIKCYGQELLELAADRIGMNKNYLRQIEESATSSMLYSFLMNPEASLRSADLIPPTDKLFMAESEIIKEIADREKCIFISAQQEACLRTEKIVCVCLSTPTRKPDLNVLLRNTESAKRMLPLLSNAMINAVPISTVPTVLSAGRIRKATILCLTAVNSVLTVALT